MWANRRKHLRWLAYSICGLVVVLIAATALSMRSPYAVYQGMNANVSRVRMLDRSGVPLSITYQNRWNNYEVYELYAFPEALQIIFVQSEDRRFFEHHGVDWLARISAVKTNLLRLSNVRGASTITEQVVRMLNPRPRNMWSRWLEGWEAIWLERNVSKADILSFYLNQVPYAANRRGVAQAAEYYFGRKLNTLNTQEILALTVMVRAPSYYDPFKDPTRLTAPIKRLADRLHKDGVISETPEALSKQTLALNNSPAEIVDSYHFLQYARGQLDGQTPTNNAIQTSLDSQLQQEANAILTQRLKDMAKKNVHHGALIVADHQRGEIIAWAVASNTKDDKDEMLFIDPILTPRQPGSALKPFLYSLALEKGWTAATVLDDSPLSEAVGSGLHNFNNYSRMFYGKVTLREALGNSLNIPALLTIQYVGVDAYLAYLQRLGFASLNREVDTYREGLALGNGEVMPLELVQAYATLANRGKFRPLSPFMNTKAHQVPQTVISDASSSLISNILSDPYARRMEFGAASVLNLPVQTAVKTGTSNDYRDAWAVGYNHRYVVGVWMGNLDRKPMQEVTGSTGAALALRSMFNELNRNQETKPLYLSPQLVQRSVCEADKPDCKRTEWFKRSDIVAVAIPKKEQQVTQPFRIVRPTENLHIAYDPRIPADKQQFMFTVEGAEAADEIRWILNGNTLPANTRKVAWNVSRGQYKLQAQALVLGVWQKAEPVDFTVK